MVFEIEKQARPLFLIGPPRSGTTLMTRLLNSHPRVLLTNETAVFMQVAEMARKSRVGRKSGILFGKNSGAQWAEVLEEYSDSMFRSFYGKLAAEQEKADIAYWGEKHPHLDMALDFISHLYPQAVYVYAIRDPRDSACSISEMNSVPIQKALRTWGKFSRNYESFAESLPEDRLITIRYEDLVDDYAGVTEKAFKALGLEFDQRAREYVEHYSNVDSHSGAAKQGSDKGIADLANAERHSMDYKSKSLRRWEKELTAEDLDLALELHGEFLERYGYDLESTVPPRRNGLGSKLKSIFRKTGR